MHYLEEELAELRKKSDDTVADPRCDARHQIAEIEDNFYANSDKAEETRLASIQQAADILAEEKEKAEEVLQLASCNMA